MNRNLTSKHTPLRNSNTANKPFRSPINSEFTPKNDKNVKLSSRSVDSLQTVNKKISSYTTPKRPHSVDENCLLKRRRIEVENIEQSKNDNSKSQLLRSDLSALKRRIRSKKQEIESVKIKLSYRNKHKAKDVDSEIVRWRQACEKALLQFQKDWNQNNSEGVSLEMDQIISRLGIPEKVAKLLNDSLL